MNPFMVWSQYQRRIICEKTPDLHNTVISKQLGQKWRELSDDEKQPFVVEADKLRKLHSIEYPDYKYRPKKKQQGSKSTTSTSSTLSSPLSASSSTSSTASGKITKSHIREVSKRKTSNKTKNGGNNNNKSNNNNNNNNNNNSNTKTLEDISVFSKYYYPNSPDSINNGVGMNGGCGSTGTAETDIFSDSELQQTWTTYEHSHFAEDDANVMDAMYTCSTPTNTNTMDGLGFDTEDTKHNIIVNDPNMNPMFTDIDSCVINQQLQQEQLHLQIDQSQRQRLQQQQQNTSQNHHHHQQQQQHLQQPPHHNHHQQHILFNDSSLQQTQAKGGLPSFVNNNNNSIEISGNFQMDTCNTMDTDFNAILQQLSAGNIGSNHLLNYVNFCSGDDNGSCGDDINVFSGLNNLSVTVRAIDDIVNSPDLSLDLNFVLNKLDSDVNLGNATGSHLEFKCDNKNLYNL